LPTARDVCRQKIVTFSLIVDTFVDKQEDTALALLGFLSYNYQKQVQNNTVLVQQEEVDWVGFEPTTLAHYEVGLRII